MPRWLKITILSLLVVANLAVLAVLWAIRTGSDALATADTDSEVSGVLDAASGDTLTFLLVGSDSREGLDDLTNFGAVGGARGDVIMLVKLDSSTSDAQILSLPRDLWVEIPGHGNNRINAAYAFGGPSLMVETIKQNLDISVNHYVEIDFVGFIEMVDELGGVEISFPNAARDVKSGLDVAAGTERIDGRTALAYARSRSYQELQGGSWVSVDANDIGRTARQREVIAAIVSELKSPTSIGEAGDVANAMARHTTIDSHLANTSVAGLFWDFKGILTGDIQGTTLPVNITTIEGKSVVVRQEPEATEILASFRAGQEISEQTIRLQVLNGNGVSGAAAEMAQTLESEGFVVADIGDADRKDYSQTIIVVPAGSENGDQVLSALGFGVVQPGTVDNDYDAIVIVGADAS
jgi:LCP family protein required for cell wall assembly